MDEYRFTDELLMRWSRWAATRRGLDPDDAETTARQAWKQETTSLPDGFRLMWPGHPDYPREFETLDSPPEFIYGLGTPGTNGREVAVVGSRAVDEESCRIAKKICHGLVDRGAALVSGGARGIDSISHEACLDRLGRTIVILPSGLDQPTPRRNRKLFERVVEEGGWILSEYPAGARVRKYFFLRRNRLIAALSEAVLLMRARESGGTHITAEAARALDKPLFAVPGSPEDRFSVGCNAWIRKGAECVWNAEQIFASMGWEQNRQGESARIREVELSDRQKQLLGIIESGGASLHRLVEESQLPIHTVQVELLGLEMLGLCRRDPAKGEFVSA